MLAVNTVASAAPRDTNLATRGYIDLVSYTDVEPDPDNAGMTREMRYAGYAPQPFFTELVAYMPPDPNDTDDDQGDDGGVGPQKPPGGGPLPDPPDDADDIDPQQKEEDLAIAIELYIWAVILAAVMTWLVHFGVVNPRNQFVNMVGEFLWRLTEPAIRPFRRIVPNLGGIDISPIILILVLMFLQMVIGNIHLSLVRAY